MPLRELVHWAGSEAGNASDTDGFPNNYLVRNTPTRLRELQASIYRYVQDAILGVLTTAGSGSAYTIASVNAASTDFSLGVPDGAVYKFRPHADCAANPTLAVGGQNAANLQWADDSQPTAGALTTADVVQVRWDSTNSRWLILSPSKDNTTAITEDTVNSLIDSAIQQGAEIWGREREWSTRVTYSTEAITALADGEWSQHTTDPTKLYVKADAITSIAFIALSANDDVLVNGTEYSLTAAPTVITGTTDVVELQVASLGTLVSSVQALTIRTRDEAIGKQDLDEQGGVAETATVTMFAGSTIPDNWLECDGSAISRTTYATLYTAIGTTYGEGDGSTTFNIPDLRGRVPIGAGTGTGLTARSVGDTGGAETHTLTTAELPAHSHTGSVTVDSGGSHTHTASSGNAGAHTHSVSGNTNSAGAHTHGVPWASGSGSDNAIGGQYSGDWDYDFVLTTSSAGAHTHSVSGNSDSAGSHTHSVTVSSAGAHSHTASATVSNTGGGGAHNNMQPFAVLRYIIKT